MSTEQLLAWIPLVPLLAALGVVASRANPNLREAVSIAAGVILFLLVATLAARRLPEPRQLQVNEAIVIVSLVFIAAPLCMAAMLPQVDSLPGAKVQSPARNGYCDG